MIFKDKDMGDSNGLPQIPPQLGAFEIGPLSSKERRRVAQLSPQIVALLRATNLTTRGEGGIIDFDLAPSPTKEAQVYLGAFSQIITDKVNRQQWARIAAAMLPIMNDIDAIQVPEFSIKIYEQDEEGAQAALQLGFLQKKLRANKALYDSRGEEDSPTLPFIKETQGVDPVIIGSERLEAQAHTVQNLFSNLGFGAYSGYNILAHREAQSIDPQSLPTLFRAHAQRFTAAENEFLGLGGVFREPKIDPRYKVELVEVDDYWVAWAKGDSNKFLMQLNIHPRHKNKWTKGKVEAMALHEFGGHFFQMQSWLDNLGREKLFAPLGVTSVHDPEQVVSEGMAQTLHHFVPEIGKGKQESASGLSQEATFELEQEVLRQMVYNNVHIFANNQKCRIQDVINYIHRFCPAEPYDEIRRQVKDRKSDPIKRSYLYAYGYGALLMKWAAFNLNRRGKKEFFNIYRSQPLTPDQVVRIVSSMVLDAPENRYGQMRAQLADYIKGPKQAT